MRSALEIYESQLDLVNDVCADPWFANQLAAVRAGDDEALRRISGSCLRMVLEIAKQKWHADCSLHLLDLVQEGNNVLVRTVKNFRGASAEEFARELRKHVEYRLTLLVQHPQLGMQA